ncbi:MAG: CIA30 family protein [Flavobacteriales bacterium]
MKLLIFFIALFMSVNTSSIFDFKSNSDIQNWFVVNDDVMGGRSTSTFTIDKDGFGAFQGTISLQNNGGFSSVRYRFDSQEVKDDSKIVIRLRGDGKAYQFRIKPNTTTYFSYIYNFETSGEWQEIEIPVKEMYPSFRGRRLNKSNFSDDKIKELAFLIGNKKEETFKLLIDKIELK